MTPEYRKRINDRYARKRKEKEDARNPSTLKFSVPKELQSFKVQIVLNAKTYAMMSKRINYLGTSESAWLRDLIEVTLGIPEKYKGVKKRTIK